MSENVRQHPPRLSGERRKETLSLSETKAEEEVVSVAERRGTSTGVLATQWGGKQERRKKKARLLPAERRRMRNVGEQGSRLFSRFTLGEKRGKIGKATPALHVKER